MEKEINMISKQIKRYSVSLIIREIYNETILRYQFLPNRLLNTQMFDTILLVKLGGNRYS